MTNTMLSETSYALRIVRDVRVPMRDGVHLSVNLFLPDAEGAFPTILQRMPYGWSGFPDGEYWARRGYAYVMQDCRGRFDSEGEFDPFVDDAQDGYDTLEWLAGQSWCDGHIGMYGPSYLGGVQWLVAPLAHPNLTALAPSVMSADFWRCGYWRNGAFSLALSSLWLCLEVSARASDLNLIPAFDMPKFFATLPLIDLDVYAGRRNEFWRDYLSHSEYGSFWQRFELRGQYDRVTAPAFLLGGWYDYYPGEAFADFTGLRAAGKPAKILIGPWSHILSQSQQLGEIDFGAHSQLDLRALLLRWFDLQLKAMPNGMLDEPPITIFVMGINQWRQETEWPLARTRFTPYYLHSDGNANAGTDGLLSPAPPTAEPPDHYRYDPANPVPTLGGNHSICWPDVYHIIQPGPLDQRPVEAREDVLVYTTSILETATEVTGPITLVLYAATSAPDTDFTAKLVDVFPDGRAINLCEGIIRARFRASIYQPSQLLTPGEVYEYRIELMPTSNVFLPGHRIRVDLTSSNFPLWDRNLNTGHPIGLDAELQIAEQTIYHDDRYPSHLVLPVIGE